MKGSDLDLILTLLSMHFLQCQDDHKNDDQQREAYSLTWTPDRRGEGAGLESFSLIAEKSCRSDQGLNSEHSE